MKSVCYAVAKVVKRGDRDSRGRFIKPGVRFMQVDESDPRAVFAMGYYWLVPRCQISAPNPEYKDAKS